MCCRPCSGCSSTCCPGGYQPDSPMHACWWLRRISIYLITNCQSIGVEWCIACAPAQPAQSPGLGYTPSGVASMLW